MNVRDPWSDLAAELEAAAAFARARGAAIEQRFYEWQKIERIPQDESRGGGAGSGQPDARDDRSASRQLHHYRLTVADLVAKIQRFRSYEPVAFPKSTKLEARHLSTAQVEADGWCGSCFRTGTFNAIATRPTGEPWYRGRCRFCGSWPEGDPPIDVLTARNEGRILRVVAS